VLTYRVFTEDPRALFELFRVIPPQTDRWRLGHLATHLQLLCQLEDDSLRAADVAEPIDVLVALHPADELRTAGAEPGDDGVDVVDGEGDVAGARGVRRRMPVAAWS
jgi:hypothetical protein